MNARSSYLYAAIGMAVAAVAAVQILSAVFGGDPTGFVRVSDANEALVEERLGREIVTAPGLGHDGYFFFQLADDPLLRDRTVRATFDDPTHRSSRILYPFVAGVAGVLPVAWIPWSLIALNVAAFGLGTLATARLSVRYGGSPILGIFFVMNLGLIYSLTIDGASVLATALLVLGFERLDAGHELGARASLAAAVLSREFTAVFAVAGLLFHHRGDRRKSLKALIAVLAPYVAVRAFFTWWHRASEVSEAATERNFGIPFRGLVEALDSWSNASTLATVAIGATLVAAAGLGYLAFRHPSIPAMGGAAAVPFLFVLTSHVLREAFDMARVFAPLPVLLPLALMAAYGRPRTKAESLTVPGSPDGAPA